MSIPAGAIRWDAWYSWDGEGSISGNQMNALSVTKLQNRAPWFAVKSSPYAMRCAPTQAQMDTEILCAQNGGLSYWAFDCYQPAGTGNFSSTPMSIAYNFYQASPNKNRIKWTWMTFGNQFGSTTYSDNTWQAFCNARAADMLDPQIFKALGRPVIFVFWSSTYIASFFNNSNANAAASITYFRNACTTAGAGNPYIVLVWDVNPVGTVSAMATTLGADAHSNYATPFCFEQTAIPQSFDVCATNVESRWTSAAATGVAMIPCACTGWDTRPSRTAGSYISSAVHFDLPTATRVGQHVTAMVNFVTSNAAACPGQFGLIYSWNECSEGGNALIPTLGLPPTAGNSTALLDAVKTALS